MSATLHVVQVDHSSCSTSAKMEGMEQSSSVRVLRDCKFVSKRDGIGCSCELSMKIHKRGHLSVACSSRHQVHLVQVRLPLTFPHPAPKYAVCTRVCTRRMPENCLGKAECTLTQGGSCHGCASIGTVLACPRPLGARTGTGLSKDTLEGWHSALLVSEGGAVTAPVEVPFASTSYTILSCRHR